MNTIIKGALYFDEDIILRPHYSGDFNTVDCDQYKTEEQIRSEYSEEHVKEFLSEYCITHEGIKYYPAEWGPYHTEKFELLSDLDSLEFWDEETEF